MNGSVTWRVEEITDRTAKKIHYRATYTRCDFSPNRIGTPAHYSHRLGTDLNVTTRTESGFLD